MKKIACAFFTLFFAFVVNGQTNCIERIKLDKCKDTVINKVKYYELLKTNEYLQRNNNTLSNSNYKIQERLDKLKVDEFLNIQDTSIFGSKFLSIDEASIPARSRVFYRLIKYIHDLNVVLNQNGSYSELLRTARENSSRASDIIDALITTVSEEVFSWLSESQVEYYRKLIDQSNELIETLK